jgi:dTDP-4-amino-4,6-dideoxygalactose transaminase
MSATAIAPLFYGGIPVFADVEIETFCINADEIERLITEKTRAIIAVNLFGHPAKLHQLAVLAKAHGIYLIEDNAQAPLAKEYGLYTGTIADVGVFSLNYHKHIHTGEGGICVTNNDQLCLRLQAIRNHAENIVEHSDLGSLTNMIGQNYRMTELSAAVGRSQLRKIENEVGFRRRIAEALSDGIRDLDGLTIPITRKECIHSYYIWCLLIDHNKLGVSRRDFSRALAAEGFPHFEGYVRPLYNLPVFKKKIAIGAHGWPFSLTNREYYANMCPVAEILYREKALLFETCAFQIDEDLIEQLINAIRKVYALRSEIG